VLVIISREAIAETRTKNPSQTPSRETSASKQPAPGTITFVTDSAVLAASQRFENTQVWHRILVVEYWNEKKVLSQRSTLVFQYPVGSKIFWAYDKEGSRRFTSTSGQPASLARALYSHPVQSFFAEDYPQFMACR